jgi:hypothetical protein
MDDVYRNAYCTIAADGAVDGSVGCIIKQNPLVTRPCFIDTDRGPMVCLPPEALLQTKFESEPLEQRAWALQERILSPRILHCASDQLFWECNEEFKCQTHPHGVKAHGDFRKVPRLVTYTLNNTNLHILWNGVIEDYCKRSLTREGDKLIALSGIAKIFQSRLTDDIYLAGLWYNSLPHALLWKVVDPASVTSPSAYRAPSWSWASIDGRILPNSTEATLDTCHLCLDILSSDVDLVSEDSTGAVKGGSLQVCGLMKRATMCNESKSLILVEELLQDDEKHSTLGMSNLLFFPDTEEFDSNIGSREIFCLLVQTRSSNLDGLVILSANDGCPDHFRRLGLFQAAGDRACMALKYNLRPSVQYGRRNPHSEDAGSNQSHGFNEGSRSKAMNITKLPDKYTGGKARHLQMRVGKPERHEWDISKANIHINNRQGQVPQYEPDQDSESWRSTPIYNQNSWGLPSRLSSPHLGFSKPNSTELSGITFGNSVANPVQSTSLRKSITKAVHVEHQAKMTEPLSVYLLDPPHTQEHFERLKPRTIVLV